MSDEQKQEERPRKTKVCIVGFADSKVQVPYEDDSYEIWGVNEMWSDPAVKRVDVLFELHDYKWICEGKRVKGHIDWLRQNLKVPVFMQKRFEDIPMSVPFPRQKIVEKYGSYFTNTISWEIALAIDLGFKEIRLYGVNMANDVEYASQRPSCEYYIGLARGMGIEVYIPPESDLLKSMYLYGFEDGELSVMATKLQAFMGEQDARIGSAQASLSQQQIVLHQSVGAKNAADYIMKAFVYPNTNFSAEKKGG